MSEISEACGGGDAGRLLVPGSLRGYRTWRPARRSEYVPEGMLPFTSVTRRRVFWAPTMTARCTQPDVRIGNARAPVPDDHRAPQAGCSCGIYAWYSPHDSAIVPAGVFGVIHATGLVLMGEQGFRAEKMQIIAVVTSNRRVAAACRDAGIGVYRRRHDLLRDHPPEDLSSLLDVDLKAKPSRSHARTIYNFQRLIFLAIGLRTALIVLAAFALPALATALTAAAAEFGMIAFVVKRMHP